MEDGIVSAGTAYNVKAAAFGAIGNGVAQDAAPIQAAINQCSSDGGGVVWLPVGTYLINTPLIILSDVTLHGVGKNLSILKASGSVSPVVQNSRAGGMVQRIGLHSFSVLGNSSTANGIGLSLAGVELSSAHDLRISGFTGTGQIPLILTSWDDSGTYRRSRENDFYGIETVGTNGIFLTKALADPATFGANNNRFFGPNCSGYTGIGIDINWGEGNSVYGAVCQTPNDATTGIRVNDAANGLYHCNTDCSFSGNTAIGVAVTSSANGTIILSRTGNGPTTPVQDNGSSTIIIKSPDTSIGGPVQLASAGSSLGFFGTATHGKVTVTGSRGGNAALANLLTALANYGLITDGTS